MRVCVEGLLGVTGPVNPSSLQLSQLLGLLPPDVPEASLLEDEDEDPIPPSTTTTIATSEQSTGSCDTSPDTVSPSLSPGFEDLSHVRPDSPAINGRSQTDDEEMLGE